MRKLWIDENPKWRSLGSGLWDYVGKEPLERLTQPIQPRSRYIEPRFVLPRRRNHSAPADQKAARTALEQLMAIHYRLGQHEWDDTTFDYFEARFRHLFGNGNASLPWLVQLARDEKLPIKQRLGAVGGMGLLARHSEDARRRLVEFSRRDDINFRFSVCIIRACWLGEQLALDELFAWMKRESARQPPNPQFNVNAPGHYGNPIFVLRRFTFPALFSLEQEKDWGELRPPISYWVEFYEKNKTRLRYVPAMRRYKLAD